MHAVERGYIKEGLALLNQAAEKIQQPTLESYRAYCLAHTERQMKEAVKTCQENIEKDPYNSVHYLMLGRIYLFAGDRKNAMKTFRRGLKLSPTPLIIKELKQMGRRKAPLIKALDRNHPLNHFLGKLLSKLNLR